MQFVVGNSAGVCRYFQFLFSVAGVERRQRVAGNDDRRLHRQRDGDVAVRPLPLLPAAAQPRPRPDSRPHPSPRVAVPLHALPPAPLQVRRPPPRPPRSRRPATDTTAPQGVHQARPRHRRQPHVTTTPRTDYLTTRQQPAMVYVAARNGRVQLYSTRSKTLERIISLRWPGSTERGQELLLGREKERSDPSDHGFEWEPLWRHLRTRTRCAGARIATTHLLLRRNVNRQRISNERQRYALDCGESHPVLMTTTHIPEIGAENPYQKTGTINRHENRACSIHYQKLIPEKFGTRLHVTLVRNRYTSFLVLFFGGDFW